MMHGLDATEVLHTLEHGLHAQSFHFVLVAGEHLVDVHRLVDFERALETA